MIEQICVTKVIDAASDKAWQAIAGIGGLERWFPVIAACCVERAAAGARRVMQLQGGGRIVDQIEAIDHGLQCLSYLRIEHPFPVSRYLGTVKVLNADGGKTKIIWTVEIDVAQQDRDEVVDFINGALSDGIDGMERDLR